MKTRQSLSSADRAPREGDGNGGADSDRDDSRRANDNRFWVASFIALGVADFGSIAKITPRTFAALRALGIVGGVGLIVTSSSDLKKSKTTDERLDAANSIAWGAQGLTYLAPNMPVALKVGLGLGVVGSTMQTAVGIRRLKRGLSERDYPLVKLGVLDAGAGLLWMTWELVGLRNPLFISAYVSTYVVAMVGREAYANKHALVAFLSRVKRTVRRYCDEVVNAGRGFQVAFTSGLKEGYASSAQVES